LTHLKSSEAEAPFVPERIRALKLWDETESWQTILNRAQPVSPKQLIVVRQIGLAGLTSMGDTANPYIIAYDGRRRIFTTPVASKVSSALWKDIDVAHSCDDWRPLFFEVWNDTLGPDELLAGFVLYPAEGRTTYHTRLIWDWQSRSSTTRAGLAEVQIEFKPKAE
jgi:hypothetical protein